MKYEEHNTIFSKCQSPVLVNKQYFTCGECPLCRRRKMMEWTLRGTHELRTWKRKALFITLTYNNKNLPREGYAGLPIKKRCKADAQGNLRMRDMQLFFKRLRKHLHKYKNIDKIKFIYCGEYGTLRWRPHYHAIIYGINENDISKKELMAIWGNGNVDVSEGPITEKSIQYTVGYASKKLLGKYQKNEVYKKAGRIPPYLRTSKGIGKQWALEHADIVTSGTITDLNMEHTTPRSYLRFIKKALSPTIRIKQYQTIYNMDDNSTLETYSYKYHIIENLNNNSIRNIYNESLRKAHERIEAAIAFEGPEKEAHITEAKEYLRILQERIQQKEYLWELYTHNTENFHEFYPKEHRHRIIWPSQKELLDIEATEERIKKKKFPINITAYSNEFIQAEHKIAEYKIELMMKGLYGKRQKMEEMQDLFQENI